MIDAVVTRLTLDCPALKSVAGAVDLADIMANQFEVPFAKRPAAFVLLAGEDASRNETGIGGVAQVVSEHVSIVLAIGGGQQAGREVAKDAVKAARDAVMACLLGWSPDGLGVLTYEGAAMLPLRPRTVWFRMTFSRLVGVSA